MLIRDKDYAISLLSTMDVSTVQLRGNDFRTVN